MKKLLNSKGETLVEVLVSILIFTMSSIILYTMVTSAARINREAKANDKAIAAQLAVAEQARNEGTPTTGIVTMTIKDSKGNEKTVATVNVTVFKNTDPDNEYGEKGSLYSYFRSAPEGGTGK